MLDLLNIGAGCNTLPPWLECTEKRLDIDPSVRPDIVASMTDMGEIGTYDAIWCSHALEHLAPHDVERALSEFLRVLRPGGFAVIMVPDLEGIAPTREVMFVAACGPVTAHDLYYGYAPYVRESPYMAHKSGFMRETMEKVLESAGFSRIRVERCADHNLMGLGVK